jgi:hypothetical protein
MSSNVIDYDFLDNLFLLSYDWCGEPIITIKKTSVEIINPNPQPVINYNVNDIDDDDDDDYNYENYDYYDDQPSRNNWTSTIKKMIPNIEVNDPNYNSHRMAFIFKNYVNMQDEYNNLLKEIRTICSCMRIKDYADFLPHNNTPEIVKVKTIIGIQLDFSKLTKNIVDDVYLLACEYGHLEIVKAYIDFKNGKLTNLDIEKAAESPNREI